MGLIVATPVKFCFLELLNYMICAQKLLRKVQSAGYLKNKETVDVFEMGKSYLFTLMWGCLREYVIR